MSDIKQDLFKIADDFSSHMRLLDILRSEGEDTGPLEKTIAEYFSYQVTRDKIDSAINYVRYCETMADAAAAEADRCKALAASFRTQAQWIKDTAKSVLEMSGQKRLEGLTAGNITLRKNGGKPAVTITDVSLIPEELVQYTGTISGQAIGWLRSWMDSHSKVIEGTRTPFEYLMDRQDVQMERIPHKGRIGEALAGKCSQCNGVGAPWNNSASVPCTACDGDGLARVPGARLEPRGNCVIVK